MHPRCGSTPVTSSGGPTGPRRPAPAVLPVEDGVVAWPETLATGYGTVRIGTSNGQHETPGSPGRCRSDSRTHSRVVFHLP